jgi:DNA-binding NarL/FixJ family response regulator
MLLLDDNPSAGDGVVALIRAQPGFQVLVASAEIEAAFRKVRQTRPDIVLLNLRRVGDDSLMAAGALHGEVPESRVIIMGMEPLHEDVTSFVRAGVAGFIMAGASFDTFLSTIHSVTQGSQVLPVELTRSLFDQLTGHGARRRPKRKEGAKRLTRPQRAVTDLIVLGLSNRAIAARLSIALGSVKRHVHNVLSKLAVNRRLELAAFLSHQSNSPDGLRARLVSAP